LGLCARGISSHATARNGFFHPQLERRTTHCDNHGRAYRSPRPGRACVPPACISLTDRLYFPSVSLLTAARVCAVLLRRACMHLPLGLWCLFCQLLVVHDVNLSRIVPVSHSFSTNIYISFCSARHALSGSRFRQSASKRGRFRSGTAVRSSGFLIHRHTIARGRTVEATCTGATRRCNVPTIAARRERWWYG
jgi:hypothetical protein